MVKVCLRKFVKFPKKVQKNGNPKGLLASLHGVFMGSTCLKSSPCVRPNFRADLIDSPFLSSGCPLWLEGFQPTVYVCTLKNINIVFFFDVAIRKVLGAYRANSFALRAYFPAFPICNPESLECFPDTFVGFLALPCVFLVSLPFLLEKIYINKKGRPCRPISLAKSFQNEMQKIKSPPRPKPLAKL